jgi:hypothetical protein
MLGLFPIRQYLEDGAHDSQFRGSVLGIVF